MRASRATVVTTLAALSLAAAAQAQPKNVAEPTTTTSGKQPDSPAAGAPGAGESDAAATGESKDTTATDEPHDALMDYVPPGAASEADEKREADETSDTEEYELPPLPPPGPPDAAGQAPAPVPSEQEAGVTRHVVLGMYAGAEHRASEDTRFRYGTSFVYGPFAAVDVLTWLRVTGYTRFETITVDSATDAFDTESDRYPDKDIRQPALDSIGLGLRVAPNLTLGGRVKLMALFDVAWTRFTAAAPVTDGQTHVRSSERAGVGLNYKAGAGVSIEPIPNWLDVSLLGTIGIFSENSQHGTAFDDVLQGFDQDGKIVHLAPLSRFRRSLELLLAVGVIL